MSKQPTRNGAKEPEAKAPEFDEVLRRMLASPPEPHKKNPAAKPAQKKPAK